MAVDDSSMSREVHIPTAVCLWVLRSTGSKLQTVAGLLYPAYKGIFCSEYPVRRIAGLTHNSMFSVPTAFMYVKKIQMLLSVF